MSIVQSTEINILQETSCPSLSGHSTISYEIGNCKDTNTIMFRITNNSGNGIYSKEWFDSGDILELIYDAKGAFTWKILQPLAKGKSVNTICFLMAALKNERLIQSLDRRYEQLPAMDFQDRMKVLMAGHKQQQSTAKKQQSKKGAKV